VADYTQHWLDTLDRLTADRAERFIDELRLAGLPIVITSGRRTALEQARLVAAGRSTTMQSRHLTGQAFDVDLYGVARNRVPAWIWNSIGPFGEQLGLKWGGRWVSFRDVGHFES
jgi:peptidoglycan L-alanyl-D-glutamate endopeptidase CwlK